MEKLKVFITWSGEKSKAVAVALRDWLPLVIQSIDPWMSEEDMRKGVIWRSKLAEQLRDTNVGIICLTPENLDAGYILFEAGALSKLAEESYVCTYLINLNKGDIGGPLSSFQHTVADKDDTKKMIRTINEALKENALTETQVDRLFEKWWPDLDLALTKLPSDEVGHKPPRSDSEKIDEILDLVRSLARQKSSIPSAGEILTLPSYNEIVAQYLASNQPIKYDFDEKYRHSKEANNRLGRKLKRKAMNNDQEESEDKPNWTDQSHGTNINGPAG